MAELKGGARWELIKGLTVIRSVSRPFRRIELHPVPGRRKPPKRHHGSIEFLSLILAIISSLLTVAANSLVEQAADRKSESPGKLEAKLSAGGCSLASPGGLKSVLVSHENLLGRCKSSGRLNQETKSHFASPVD